MAWHVFCHAMPCHNKKKELPYIPFLLIIIIIIIIIYIIYYILYYSKIYIVDINIITIIKYIEDKKMSKIISVTISDKVLDRINKLMKIEKIKNKSEFVEEILRIGLRYFEAINKKKNKNE